MRTLRLFLLLFLLGGTAVFAQTDDTPAIAPDGGPVFRVSVAALTGAQGNAISQFPHMSGGGRYVVFASDATNLVADDNNNASDIFLHDRETGQTELISQRSDGGRANGSSYSPTVSDDGRYVTYHSFASNLVNNDVNSFSDIFLYDRQTSETFLVTFVIDGFANNVSFEPVISGNGRYIAFYSYATNLVADDTNTHIDVFRYDHTARTIERVSVDSNEVQSNGNSIAPSISDDGQKIAFESTASNLVTGDGNTYTDIFLRDLSLGTTERISLDTNEVEANGASVMPALSGNGLHIAFLSLANNLVPDDTNDYQDVFVRDIGNSSTERVSIGTDGTQANRSSNEPAISDNGRYVAFQSFADNLIFGDPVFAQDVFVYDREFKMLKRESVSGNDVPGNDDSRQPSLSGDGRFVAYLSEATNLIDNDTNGVPDIYVHDRQDPPELAIDFTTGFPSSHFVLTGESFRPLFTAEIVVNGVLIGLVSTDNNGDFTARIVTNIDTGEGLYLVEIIQSDIREYVFFTLADDAPIRSGSGSGYTLPATVPALDKQLFLPSIRR